jgi:flagellar M-ring protein FliF
VQQILGLWNALDTRRRVIVAVATLGMFAAVLGLARMAASPSMSLLYAGLDGSAAGEVIAALEQRGVAHEVRGDAIFVPAPERDALRMALAGEGLPATTGKGYELLDGLSGFGTTSQMFDAAYWRAKEGELARTILAHPGVRAARVHLASTGSNPFQRDVRHSASVSVTTGGLGLSPRHARALQFLVASAVAGLAPEDVAIIDSEGGLVGTAEDAPANAPDSRAEALRLRALRLLEAHVGPGNAVVEVTLETETRSEKVRERRIDPESRVAISTDTEDNAETATGTGGTVTVASNLPEGDGGGGGASRSNREEARERVNYEVSTTEREIVQGPGALRRMSVAVLVNATPGPANGTAADAPQRTGEDLEALRELVASAVGLDTERGDALTLRALPFEAAAPAGTLAAPGLLDRLGLDAMALVQAGVLAAVALVLGLFVLRPVLLRPAAATAPARLGVPERRAAAPARDGSAAPAPLTGEIDEGEFDERGLSLVSGEGGEGGTGGAGAGRAARTALAGRRHGRCPGARTGRSAARGPGRAAARADRRAAGRDRGNPAHMARRRRGANLMSISHLLEDFDAAQGGREVTLTDVSLEEERLAAFETGYQAGWDDAVKAQTEDARRITADLAQNLQDLSFTFEEAQAAVMQALRPLLTQMTSAVLPRLAQESLGPRLAGMLDDLVRDQGRCSIEITASPADMPRLSGLLASGPALGATLTEDDTLGPGQVSLRFGEAEHEIDLGAVLEGIDAAIRSFFDQTQQGKASA